MSKDITLWEFEKILNTTINKEGKIIAYTQRINNAKRKAKKLSKEQRDALAKEVRNQYIEIRDNCKTKPVSYESLDKLYDLYEVFTGWALF